MQQRRISHDPTRGPYGATTKALTIDDNGNHEPYDGSHSHHHQSFGAKAGGGQHTHQHFHERDNSHAHPHSEKALDEASAALAALRQSGEAATAALAVLAGNKSWDQQQMSASAQFISGHWQRCLAALDRVYITTVPPEEALPIRAAARAEALHHLDLMRLAMDELSTELKNQQALAAAGDRQ